MRGLADSVYLRLDGLEPVERTLHFGLREHSEQQQSAQTEDRGRMDRVPLEWACPWTWRRASAPSCHCNATTHQHQSGEASEGEERGRQRRGESGATAEQASKEKRRGQRERDESEGRQSRRCSTPVPRAADANVVDDNRPVEREAELAPVARHEGLRVRRHHRCAGRMRHATGEQVRALAQGRGASQGTRSRARSKSNVGIRH